MAYLKLQTVATTLITINTISSTWNNNGNPLIIISGMVVPDNILLQETIIPEYLNVDSGIVTNMFNNYQSTSYEDPLVLYSGAYYTEYTGDGKTPFVTKFDQIIKDSENTNYQYWYGIRYIGDETDVYNLITKYESTVLTKAAHPNIYNIGVKASGYPIDDDNSQLALDFTHYSPLVNSISGLSNYEIYIENTPDPKNSYSISGVMIPGTGNIPSENILRSGTFRVTLPFSYTNSSSIEVQQNYNIRIKYQIILYLIRLNLVCLMIILKKD